MVLEWRVEVLRQQAVNTAMGIHNVAAVQGMKMLKNIAESVTLARRQSVVWLSLDVKYMWTDRKQIATRAKHYLN